MPLRAGDDRLNGLAGVGAASAAFAAAEMFAATFLGNFFALGRAEALLFLAFRPWLLLAAAALVQPWPWRKRFFFYGLALLLAALSESLFLLGLGAANPWPEALRGVVAGLLLLLLFDPLLQLGGRFVGRVGRALSLTLLILLLLVPGSLRPYERIVLGADPPLPGDRPVLMLMSALPLRWGEKGPLEPGSRPAEAYLMLAKEFRIRALDRLDEESLAAAPLMLLAQPRALAPEELVAFDAWVRRGGRVLILTDPALKWPSELPVGDIRRAPPLGLLDPLLTYWGLHLDPPSRPQPLIQHLTAGGGSRRLILNGAGSFVATGPQCRVGATPQTADCWIGAGRAMLLADADLLHDDLWTGPGSGGAERHARRSDNPIVIADWLDGVAGRQRQRVTAPVQWLAAPAGANPWLFGLLPILLAAGAAAILRLRRRG